MKLLVLNSTELQELLNLDELRDVMRDALISSYLKQTRHFPRHVTPFSAVDALGIMPAINGPLRLMGYKAVTVFPGNAAKGINPHQGVVVLLDHETGQIKCMMDGSTITALRTAAVSALATDVLSRGDSTILAVIGAGRQAYEHIRAIVRIRQIREIRILSRDKKKAEALSRHPSLEGEASFVISDDPHDAIDGADIVATCTSSKEPLFATTDLESGTHINAIGACRPGFREIVVRSQPGLKIFLDNHEACANEADEIFRSPDNERISRLIVGEIGEVLAGQKSGRETGDEITVFKSVGLAAEDIFSAEFAYRMALGKKDVGVAVEFSQGNPRA